MTEADKYWARKVKASPALAKPTTAVTMKSAALEKEIRKAFEAGKKAGTRLGFKLGQHSKESDAERNIMEEFYKQLGDS